MICDITEIMTYVVEITINKYVKITQLSIFACTGHLAATASKS